MSGEMDDPFTTPQRSPNHDSHLISLPSSSPSQIKRTLEAHLQEINKRIETAGSLGRALLSQQQEYEARIKELEQGGDSVDPELKKKIMDLAKEYNEVGRESARAVLTNKIMGGGTSPYGAGNLSGSSPSGSNLQAQGTNSPTKLTVPSRRQQRNQSSRQHDLEFAAELGQGLLVEVRRLQALLSEREEALKIIQIEKAALEQQAEHLESRVRSFDESEQKYKEENWDLELSNQDLQAQARDQQEIEDRLHGEIQRLCHEKEDIIKELDEWKHQNEKLFEDLEAEHKHHEVEFATMRRNLATNENERIALEKKVEELKQELEESHNQSVRLRASLEHQADKEDDSDPFVLVPAQTTPEHSPPPSPTKPTPRHTHLEAETLKSSLQHAHRMITNLKSNMNREKTEKAELRRLLQEARDELETARLRRDSLGGPPSSADKRRKGKAAFIKSGAVRPIFNTTLLGGPRRPKDEVTMIEDVHVDEEWEEAPEEEPSPTRSTFPPSMVLRDYTLSPPSGNDDPEESAFETANETAGATDAFETANEQDGTATETEAYRTGNESPVNDYPTSPDELTETESGALLQVIQKKSSRASSFGGSRRSGKLGKIRHRDSVASSASTEDDSDSIYEDSRRNRHDEFMTPVAGSSQRLKLKMGRARSRGSRMTSQSSMFSNRERAFSAGSSNRDRAFSAGSSEGGAFQRNGSPNSVRQKLSTPGERKSLFAELEDGMLVLDGDDGEEDGDTAEEDEMPTTPTKSSMPLMPFVTKPDMVDCGVMTEEPYPEILEHPELDRTHAYLGVGEMERPRTAFSAISMNTIEERAITTDVGTQSEKEPEPIKVEMFDASIQSEEEPKPVVMEMGTQSDETSVAEVGIQSDGAPVTEIGTQSDPEPVTPMVEIGTQSDPEKVTPVVEMGTQSDPEEAKEEKKDTSFIPIPLPLPVPIPASHPDLRKELHQAEEELKVASVRLAGVEEAAAAMATKLLAADEASKLAAAKLLESDEARRLAVEKLLKVEEEVKTAAEKLLQFEESEKVAAAKLLAADESGRLAAEKLRLAEEDGRLTGGKLRQVEEEAKLAVEKLAKVEEEARLAVEKLAQEEENGRLTVAKLIESDEAARVTAERLRVAEEEMRAAAAKLAVSEEESRTVAAKLAVSEEEARAAAAKLATLEEDGGVAAAKLVAAAAAGALAADRLRAAEEGGKALEEKLRKAEEDGRFSKEVADKNAADFIKATEEVNTLKPVIVKLEEEIEALKEERGSLVEERDSLQETVSSIPVLDMKDTGIQFDPEMEQVEKEIVVEERIVYLPAPVVTPVSVPVFAAATQTMQEEKELASESTQTVPEEIIPEEYTVVVDKVAEVEPSIPEVEVPLEFSEITVQDTEPIEPIEPVEPVKPKKPTSVLPVPVPISVFTVRDASVSSDDETPKKVSETVEDQQQRPTTPSLDKASGFWVDVGGWKRPGSPEQEPEGLKGASERTFSTGTFGGGIKDRQIDVPTIEEPKAPAVDQEAQTDITYEFFDNLATAKTVDKGKKPAFAVVAPEPMFIGGDRSAAKSPSLRSHGSYDSFGLNKLHNGGSSAIKRPGSAASLRDNRTAHPPLPPDHKEHIAAAQQKIPGIGTMGPPPVPSSSSLTQRNNVTFRPRTPVSDTIKAIGPETPNSKAGTTPRPTPRFSTTRSEVSSPTSRRSSISSFASELDTRFNIAPEAVAGEAQTDPRMIQAITQTMIGEYLWKYTRNAGRGSLSHSRHKRFFWVHPYTRTLYWSERDPTTAGRAELRAKSVAIEAVRVVTDDNPMPPGLHRKSLVVMTPGRSLKFTAPTGQRHETWFNALSYLLLRTGGELGEEENSLNPEDVRDFNPSYSNGNGTPGSVRGAESLSSYNTRATRASSPARNTSSLSNKRPGEKVVRQGSMSRLSNLFRPTSGFGTFSTRSSRNNTSLYDQSELNDSAEDLREQIEAEERDSERLENVRACCDGKHDVGTLPRRGGRKTTQSTRGRGVDPHHYHHTHTHTHTSHERNPSQS